MIDWEMLARQIGDITPERESSGTASGRRALELLLGEETLRGAVDYWISQKPGCFTAEMVLSVIRSKVAMGRCYEIYKTEHGTERAGRAVFLLASFADIEALPWIGEFLEDNNPNIRWNGLMVLRTVAYGPLGDAAIATAKEFIGQSGDRSRFRDTETREGYPITVVTSPLHSLTQPGRGSE